MYNRKIVLDFDGTICRLFANYDLNAVNERVGVLMKDFDIDFPVTLDLFDSFNYVSEFAKPHQKQELLLSLDEIITEVETEALESGIIIAGFYEFLDFAKSENICIGIASNNSEKCIREFLNKYCDYIDIPVAGRDPLHPELMKPDSYILEKICNKMECTNKDVVFIGDNIRDYECAKKYDTDFIALTPTSKKYERIVENGLDVNRINIVKDFFELIALLRASK